ncbi:MAG: hypothetical protein IPG93_07720 [Burkholderiales bacterium]|nr:hypothetical protein [Burkholderiales bacterium]
MSIATTRGSGTVPWQYHSRSDSHSKVACWTLLFDLLLECDSLRDAAAQGRIGFGINYEMVGPINKTLDLVITLVDPDRDVQRAKSFVEIGAGYGIALTEADTSALAALPSVYEDRDRNASEVAIALEAKACMTEHVKSLPRLHAEILATGYLARQAQRQCITVSYSLVNAANDFRTPSSTTGKVNHHSQPSDARRVVNMIDLAIPVATKVHEIGYDVVGVSVIDCSNDGSPVTLVDDPTMAPTTNSRLHYTRMVRNICSEFRARFRR